MSTTTKKWTAKKTTVKKKTAKKTNIDHIDFSLKIDEILNGTAYDDATIGFGTVKLEQVDRRIKINNLLDNIFHPEKYYDLPFNKNVVIHLLEKMDEKIFNNTLMKLGFISIKIENSEISGKYYYLKLVYEFERGEKITNSSIKLDTENSCIYIDDTFTYSVDIFGEIEKLLLDNKIIDRDEIYTKSGSRRNNHKIHDIEVSDIIKEIEFGNEVQSAYRGNNGITNNAKEILTKHFIKFLMDKYKEELSLSENNSKNEAEKEEVEEQSKELNIEKLNPIIKQCENKINEIKEIIKDFDYSDKKTYEEATSKIEKDLEELENKDISVSRVNEIIDEINETYRNAYKKKNNVSALSYIMETDEDIDLIKKIDIDNL